MHALIVVAHPDLRSLSHAVASEVAAGLTASGADHTFEIADLAAEGFDPRFTMADRAVYHRTSQAPEDVVAEQTRIERADALVLVYPVFWWSMPAVLKGWIDRVFSNGWAFEDGPGGAGLIKKLPHLPIHLMAVAGGDARMFARHGYSGAMRTQIEHGIFDYCGSPVLTSELLMESETSDPLAHLATARAVGAALFAAPPDQAASRVWRPTPERSSAG